MKHRTLLTCSLAFFALPFGLWAQSAAQNNSRPKITITMIPPSDPGGPDKMATIEGVVANSCENCRVILFAHGDVWYVQPYAANPSTAIRADGTWRNQTHLGTEYAALVVTQGYDPPPTSPELPEVGGKIVASTVVEGRR